MDEKYITGIEDVELKDNTVNARGDGAFWLTTVEDAKVKYDVDDDTVFVYVDVEPVSFHRGFYTVDMRFFYHVTLQAYLSCPAPVTVEGLCVFDKRAILFGSEGSAKIFSSQMAAGGPDPQMMQRANNPIAVVEAVDPSCWTPVPRTAASPAAATAA